MTGNSTCTEIYYDQHSYLPCASSALLPLVEAEDRPVPFEGDYFGDYAPQDFGWRDHNENDLAGASHAGDEQDNSNSDHGENLDVDLEHGWEPKSLPPITPPLSGDVQQLPPPNPNTQHWAEACFSQKPTIENSMIM